MKSKNVFERRRFLSSALVSGLITVAIVLAAEYSLRRFAPRIQFVGQDASLIQHERFGRSPGNRPRSTGFSWGVQVVTDQFGFRVPTEAATVSRTQCSILIMGDSVPFGVGVEANEIFPTLVGRGLGRPVCNAGVIGYNVDDYNAMSTHLVIPSKAELNLAEVALFITLNDIHRGTPTAVQARQEITDGIDSPPIERAARAVRSVFDFNGFLIRRSQLYIALKGLVYDSSRWWFLADHSAFREEQLVEPFSAQLRQLVDGLHNAGVEVTVFLLPYEYQLRHDGEELLEPQRVMRRILQELEVRHWDLYPDFAAYPGGHKELFLYNDHCHLSVRGHALVAEKVIERLVSTRGHNAPSN